MFACAFHLVIHIILVNDQRLSHPHDSECKFLNSLLQYAHCVLARQTATRNQEGRSQVAHALI